jgi:tyrosine-protein phosphatase SIW14
LAKNYFKILLTLSTLFLSGSYIQAQNLAPCPNTVNKLNITGFSNLYKVDDNLYRCEQPSSKGFILIDSIGIKSVIDLRQRKTDNHKIKKTDLKLVNVPMNAWTISYKDIVAGIKAIKEAKKPVLIHCKHGSDRTGCIVAVYRIIMCGWTREDAIKEFRYGGFHYHEKSFPNILRLLETVDIEQLKKDIGQ